MFDRRQILAAPFVLTLAETSPADGASVLEWRGYRINMSALEANRRGDIAAYLRQQIDLVESVPVQADIKAWFPTVPMVVDPTLDMAGRYHGRCILLDDRTAAPENPMLLHELMHAYMALRLPMTGALRRFYEQARTSGDWPDQAYMLRDIQEFFAMTASVVLWGSAARPPYTRERLRQAMPDYHDWLVREFGLPA